MKFDEVNKYILGFPGVQVGSPFSEGGLVYSLNDQMFAIIDKNKSPLRLSLKCDAQLSKLLRQKYEEVMPGDHLDEKNWNTIVLSGQLGEDEVKDLIRHSYLVTESSTVTETDD